MEFKVGDKVKVTLRTNAITQIDDGITGTIIEINNEHDGMLIYKLDHAYYDEFFADELEYYRVRYTKLAAKMYPKGRKDGEFWVIG